MILFAGIVLGNLMKTSLTKEQSQEDKAEEGEKCQTIVLDKNKRDLQ